MREPGAPRLIAADQVGGTPEAQIHERCRRQARCIAGGAHHDDRLVETSDRGQAMVRGRVQAPLEHVAFHDDGAGERALVTPLLSGPNVDDEPALGHKAFKLMGSDKA